MLRHITLYESAANNSQGVGIIQIIIK